MLRHTFRLNAPTREARLYATAHGVYETFLNGRRVGDVELAPGFTSYPTTLHVQVYDVGALLAAGDNVWEVVLSDGWWRGRTGFFQGTDGFGGTLGFLGQLHAGDVVDHVGPRLGVRHRAAPQRRPHGGAGRGPPERPGLLGGRHGRRRRPRVPGLFPGAADPQGGGAPPVAVTRLGSDRQVVDLGQNINGWLRLCDVGPAGTELTIVHGEFLEPSGDVTQDHL